VSSLLQSLHENHRSQVKWYPSETVFRFGNHGILRSIGALFVPFGDMWMKIEVVKGSTPFLISNAFLHALHADLLVSQSCLRVPTWKNDVKLNRNSKGLFIVKLSELLEAAGTQVGNSLQEEVITLSSSLHQGEGKVNKQALQQQPSLVLHGSENVNTEAEAAQSRPSTCSVCAKLSPRIPGAQTRSQWTGKCSLEPCRIERVPQALHQWQGESKIPRLWNR
jgi:hypothetical protein